MNLSDWKRRFDIQNHDIDNIQKMGEAVKPFIAGIIDQFYIWIFENPLFSGFFRSEAHITSIKELQNKHWLNFWNAGIDQTYIESRIKIGSVHANIGLPLDSYFESVVIFNKLFTHTFIDQGYTDFHLLRSYQKLIDFDVAIIVDTYNRLMLEKIENQNNALKEMSVPVTRLWDGILLLPLVGFMDSKRAQNTMATMLDTIEKSQAKAFILDISGVAVVDTAVANYLIKISKASQLMGCTCLISGISGSVAQTITELGIQIEEVNTTSSLKEALNSALKITNAKVVQTF